MIARPILLALAAVTAALALPSPAAAQQPSPVRVDPVRLETVGDRRLVTGDIRARRTSLVASREAGVLLESPVREGDVVAAGDLLGRLDAERLDLELAILDAQVEVAQSLIVERESDVGQAARDVQTLMDLASNSAANPKEVADAITAEAIARARLDQARRDVATLVARRALVQRRRDDSELRAPFDGLVVRRAAEIGQWLGEGDAIVELVSHADLEAWLEVPQRFLAPARAHAERLHLRLDATDQEFEVGDARIVPLVDPLARTFTMIVSLPPGEASLATGMSVTAWIPTGATADYATVSSDAILRNDVGTYVYVAQPGGEEGAPHMAMPMPVRVLFSSGGRVVVDAPRLPPGAPVIVEGNERLFPMAPVIPMPVAGTQAEPSR